MGREASLTPDILPPGRRIALMDIDGTLTNSLTISSFAEYLDNNGFFNPGAWEQMEEDFKRYGESDHGHVAYEQFAKDIVLHYAEGLKGHKVSDMGAMASQFFASVGMGQIVDYRVYPFSHLLAHHMNRIGTIIAISGSPVESLVPLKQALNLGDLRATTIGEENGVYLGTVGINLALDTEKQKVVDEYITSVDLTRSFAFGDTTHDLPLLEAVENPFVVGDNPHLSAVARRRGWPIIDPDSPNAIDEVVERIDQLFKT